MTKHEIKVEMRDSSALSALIESAYHIDGENGTIKGNNHRIELDPVIDEEMHRVLTGLHNSTVKVINTDVVDGTIRFIVTELSGVISISPVSVRCIKEDRWIFY